MSAKLTSYWRHQTDSHFTSESFQLDGRGRMTLSYRFCKCEMILKVIWQTNTYTLKFAVQNWGSDVVVRIVFSMKRVRQNYPFTVKWFWPASLNASKEECIWSLSIIPKALNPQGALINGEHLPNNVVLISGKTSNVLLPACWCKENNLHYFSV